MTRLYAWGSIVQNDARAGITVFSDYVCPYCCLEEPDPARVREQYGEVIEVDWRAYEMRSDSCRTGRR